MRDVKEYAKRLRQTPPVPCSLSVGDTVTFTNEAGLSFEGMKIIGFADDDSFHGRFIHFVGPVHPGAYWFPCRPDELSRTAIAKATGKHQ
ncbi:hypothetical protein [Kerstersia similis]|uniref:hypothetical protein n=1 Tax=Kerstersia similis TaxID=206505 RepID=UPI0039F00C74